jgi:hypothetical protein
LLQFFYFRDRAHRFFVFFTVKNVQKDRDVFQIVLLPKNEKDLGSNESSTIPLLYGVSIGRSLTSLLLFVFLSLSSSNKLFHTLHSSFWLLKTLTIIESIYIIRRLFSWSFVANKMTKIAQIIDRSSATAWCPIASQADVIAIGAKVGIQFQ